MQALGQSIYDFENGMMKIKEILLLTFLGIFNK